MRLRPLWLSLLVGLLLPLTTLHAATIYYAKVGGTGTTCGSSTECSLTTGIGKLTAGDTLYLRAGTYNQFIDGNAFSPFPAGTSFANPVIIASAPGETAILAPSGGTATVINLPDTSQHYIIFDRLVLDAAGVNSSGSGADSTGYAISIGSNGAHHIRFTNCDIKNAWSTNIAPFGDAHEFIGNTVHHSAQSYGFYISHGNNVVLDGNTIHDNGGYGIQIYDGSYPSSSTNNNIVRNNTIYNNGFVRAFGAMVIGEGSGTIAYNNVIYNNWGGVQLRNTAASAQLYNNTITGGPNEAGIRLDASGALVRNNIVFNNGGAIDNTGSSNTTTPNTTANPTFVNAAANDYHLQSSSVARNAGANLTTICPGCTTDAEGAARPGGTTAWDNGAYRFGAAASTPPAPTNLILIGR